MRPEPLPTEDRLHSHVGIRLTIVCSVAFLLRLIGVAFGMPLMSNLYIRPDETLVITRALQFFEADSATSFVVYPGLMPLLLSILFQSYWNTAHWLGLTNTSGVLEDFASNCNPYFLIARMVSVVAGTAVLVFVYDLGRYLHSSKVGIAAAALYAVAPLPVRDAHFGVTDTLLVLLATGVICCCVRYVDVPHDNRWRLLSMGAVLFGLALATKYFALFLAVPLILAVVIRSRSSDHRVLTCVRELLGGLCMAGLIFALLNMDLLRYGFILVGDFQKMAQVFYQGSQSQASLNLLRTCQEVIEGLTLGPGGAFGLVLLSISIGFWVRERKLPTSQQAVLLGALLGVCLPLLPFRHGIPYRYILPMLPVVSVAVAVAFVFLGQRLQLSRRVLVTTALLLFLPSLWASLRIDMLLVRNDTRTLAGNWIVDHVPQDYPILLFGGPECEPQLVETRPSIERRIEHVYRLYGPRGGEITSILYRLQLDHPKTLPAGYDLYRLPKGAPEVDRPFVAVVPSHPLSMAGFDPSDFNTIYENYELLEKVEFIGPRRAWNWLTFDEIDAFFLPMNGWFLIERPGPRMEVFLFGAPKAGDSSSEDQTARMAKRSPSPSK